LKDFILESEIEIFYKTYSVVFAVVVDPPFFERMAFQVVGVLAPKPFLLYLVPVKWDMIC
jgi:hypothetical protein